MSEAASAEEAGLAVKALVELMDRLRTECPWDRKQTFADLAGYLLEECYEALEALSASDFNALEGELGDLLFELVFLARLGSEERAFDMGSIARRIHMKMVARHPHVFGDARINDAEGVRLQWEALKRKEREANGSSLGQQVSSPFEGLPKSLPALLKAVRLASRAADMGFDWIRDDDVLDKLDEEVAEFRREVLNKDASKERISAEIGDMLFTVVNVARRFEVDPEAALQGTNARFRRRFEGLAKRVAASGGEVGKTPAAELDRLWEDEKAAEGPLADA